MLSPLLSEVVAFIDFSYLGNKQTLVMGSEIFSEIWNDTNLTYTFTEILHAAPSFIGTRLMPNQKAQLVQLSKLKYRTLAIGDGANDVPALEEANIGVAVKGNSLHSIAASKADFAITTFKDLIELLLIQGTSPFQPLPTHSWSHLTLGSHTTLAGEPSFVALVLPLFFLFFYFFFYQFL